MSASVTLAVILLVIGLFVLSLELFLPSAGLLFVIALMCIIGSLVTAFWVHVGVGAIFLLIVTILAFILPSIGFKIWKRTPIGRRMFLDHMGEDDDPQAADEDRSRSSSFDSLMGEIGKTLTPLRPVGMTEIHGRRIDTITEGVMINQGEYVRVVEVHGNRVVVRKIDMAEQPTFAPDFDEEET